MSIPSFATINNTSVQAALAEAAERESGTILNDHYSPDFYTERRARFLGRHPDYNPIGNGLFVGACDDADTVFGNYQGDLSVQEIRRREIMNEVIPLLPLPTTWNTETIDDHAELPDSEWAEGKVGVRRILTPTPTPSPPRSPICLPGDVATMNDGLGANGQDVDQSEQQADDDDIPLAHLRDSSLVGSQQTARAGPQNGAVAQQPSNPDVLSRIVGELNRRWSPQQNAANASTSASAPNRSTATANAQQGRAPPNVMRQTASSYANRATNTKVKVRKGTKRNNPDSDDNLEYVSTDSEAGNDSAASEHEASPPSRKRVKLNADPKPTVAKSRTARPVDSRASSKVQETSRKATARKKKPQPKQDQTQKEKTSAFTKSGPTLEAVVAGTALPRTRAQAEEADEVRYELLCDQHNARLRSRKKKSIDEPESMPEYFQTSLFPEGKERNQVRCTCGVVVDDYARMLSCDTCTVWQHIACVGEAAPKDLETGSYKCHNCDPWIHRRVIQRLRKANAVQFEG